MEILIYIGLGFVGILLGFAILDLLIITLLGKLYKRFIRRD